MPLSGEEVIKLFLKAEWDIHRQKGSHVAVGWKDLRASIPLHRELSPGLERELWKWLANP